MCNCHSILECCVMFSGVKLSIGSFNLLTVANLSSVSSTKFATKTKQLGTFKDFFGGRHCYYY